MRFLPPILLLGLLAVPGQPAEPDDRLPPPPDGKSWKLVWHDEFEGDRLDESKWTYRPDGRRKGGWWSREAVNLDGNGHLVITTFMDGDKPTDGCVTTQGKFEHAFGYYVARVQFQREPGHWSAFWITGPGVGRVGDGGRDGAEIDIMEKPWLDDRVTHNLHWDGYGEHHKHEGTKATVPGLMDGWHTFGLLWLPGEYVFYVDGEETWRTKAGGVCQVPQYMLLSDEIGSWAGDITKAKLPDRFMVDYVRVYDLVKADVPSFSAVNCEGTYPHHLQGICTNDQDAIYWSFTTTLVKTDQQGHVLTKIPVANHHGDLCYHDGKIYVAVNLGRFNDPKGNADSWVYVYDAGGLSFLKKYEVQQVFHGAGGISCWDGRFFVVGGLPKGVNENYVYEYDQDFRFVKKHVINSGNTLMGIQTAAFADGHWWFGCYGSPKVMLKTDKFFGFLGKYEFDCSLGIVGLPNGRFLVVRGSSQPGTGCSGSAVVAHADAEKGMVVGE